MIKYVFKAQSVVVMGLRIHSYMTWIINLSRNNTDQYHCSFWMQTCLKINISLSRFILTCRKLHPIANVQEIYNLLSHRAFRLAEGVITVWFAMPFREIAVQSLGDFFKRYKPEITVLRKWNEIISNCCFL